MFDFRNLEEDKKVLYSTDYYSGDYSHELYIKKAIDDGSNKPKFYIRAYTRINGELVPQGYIYFYLDYENKTSNFVGVKVLDEYRNLNIASLLISSWIDLCLNNGFDFLGLNRKQRKPFLLYMLKTYGFEVQNKKLYDKRDDVITICKSKNPEDLSKLLMFKSPKHEFNFIHTNVYKTDNYVIIHSDKDIIMLDHIILPLQDSNTNPIDYTLTDYDFAKARTQMVLSRHRK